MRLDGSITATTLLPSSPSRAGAVMLVTLLAAPAILLFLSGEATRWLEYDFARIAAGEWWRVVTCHWTHWSASHLVWDLAVFVALLAACLGRGRRRVLAALATAALLIPAGIWLLIPGMATYRGLSGLDSALFMLLAVDLLRRARRDRRRAETWVVGIALAGFAAKLLFEIATGQAFFVDSEGFVPVPLAHLIGGACGAVCALASFGARPHRTHGGTD